MQEKADRMAMSRRRKGVFGTCIVAGVLLISFPLVIHAEAKPKKVEIGKEIVLQVRVGSHNYKNDGERSTQETGLWGFIIGKHVNPNLMIGMAASFARRRYESGHRNLKISYEEKVATSFVAIARWVFRPHGGFQPYVDAGLGRTEVLDDGQKISLTVGVGAQYRFGIWAITIENRDLGWDKYSPGSPDGANEITLGCAFFF